MKGPRHLALLAAIFLLAFTLRAYRLEQQDLWGDEGVSYKATLVTFPDLIRLPWWISPPLYYASLNLWTRLAGKTLFALRFLSLMAGLLAMAVIYRLACSLFGASTGLIAAFVCAISPVQVYYSQETRMYTLVTLEAGLLIWFLALLSQEQGRRSPPLWIGYFLTALVAVYTHYTVFLLLIAQALWVLLIWRRSISRFALGGIMLFLSYTPWVWVLWQRGIFQHQVHSRFSELNFRSLLAILRDGFTTFGVGFTVKGPLSLWLTAALLVAVGLGSAFVLLRNRAIGWLLLFCLFAPLVFAWAVNPLWAFFHPRYLLVAFPAFCLLLACGLQAAAQRWSMAALAFVAVVSAYSLGHYFFDAYAKGRYGAMMRYVQAHARPGDFLLLENRQQWPLFDYYHPEGIPYAYFPQEKAADEEDVHREMSALARGYNRIWLVMFGDPMVYDAQHRVKRWLAEHGYIAFHRGFLDADLSLFVMAGSGERIQHPLEFKLGGKIELIGYSLSSPEVRAGDTLLLTLYWRAMGKVERPYTVFTHLLDRENRVRAQMDSQPLSGTHPTDAWEVGEVVKDDYGLEIPPDAPPGEYLLEVGMYYLPTMERLPVTDASGQPVEGNRIVVGTIKVKDGGS